MFYVHARPARRTTRTRLFCRAAQLPALEQPVERGSTGWRWRKPTTAITPEAPESRSGHEQQAGDNDGDQPTGRQTPRGARPPQAARQVALLENRSKQRERQRENRRMPSQRRVSTCCAVYVLKTEEESQLLSLNLLIDCPAWLFLPNRSAVSGRAGQGCFPPPRAGWGVRRRPSALRPPSAGGRAGPAAVRPQRARTPAHRRPCVGAAGTSAGRSSWQPTQQLQALHQGLEERLTFAIAPELLSTGPRPMAWCRWCRNSRTDGGGAGRATG